MTLAIGIVLLIGYGIFKMMDAIVPDPPLTEEEKHMLYWKMYSVEERQRYLRQRRARIAADWISGNNPENNKGRI